MSFLFSLSTIFSSVVFLFLIASPRFSYSFLSSYNSGTFSSPLPSFGLTNCVCFLFSVELYFQVGLQETRNNALLELFCQMITEPAFDTLRTKEQLGYIVFSGVRRSNGVQGLFQDRRALAHACACSRLRIPFVQLSFPPSPFHFPLPTQSIAPSSPSVFSFNICNFLSFLRPSTHSQILRSPRDRSERPRSLLRQRSDRGLFGQDRV